ncbi:hypothetical protein GLOIN_2v1868401 [Rhizophagus clarus]|uniref:TLDc domain-containing protein n=1 Tax=Rhizophagus clarus TaxID=94130 RepID=A0A8H3QY16_9GLOM|nr:hypothetical protein GLOIN_2v1868401 [Rhizophagus clarus]
MVQSPEKILSSFNFTSLSEKSLISLIKRDGLQMKEVEVWEHVLKWGLAQNPNLIPDPITWSDDDFKKMENTLQHCLPLIRFFSLPSKEFLQSVRPYQKLLNRQLYEDIINSYMDPDSKPDENKIERIIDSKIVTNLKSYKFKLLLRGSRDGFTPKKFHELCNNKPKTVTFIKIKGTKETIGGYNPLIWESSNTWVKVLFFLLKIMMLKVESLVMYKLQVMQHVMVVELSHNSDMIFLYILLLKLWIMIQLTVKKNFYEKKIRDVEDKFSIEDYEVFQILR